MTSLSPRPYLTLFLIFSLGYRFIRLWIAVRHSRASKPGRITARPMFWVMTLSYLLFVTCAAREGVHRADRFSWPLSLAGFAVFVSALALRERAMADLGRFFSPDIEIRSGHQVVREGLYHHVRHPLLACMGLEILGLSGVFNAFQTFAVLGLGFYFPLIELRRWIEERALVRTFGEAYRAYQAEVGAFLPKWHV